MTTPRSEPHLPPRLVAAFLEGDLSSAERAQAEAHLALCTACRRELVEVRRLADGGRGTRRLAPAAAIAAAAVILLAAGLATLSGRLETPDGPLVRARDPAAVTAVHAVSPAPGASLSAEDLRFVWNAAPAGSTYRIVVLDASGSPIWSHETADTTATLPPEIELAPAETFFWFVDALAADGSSLTSGARRFSIR